jgi:hypothetical protein
LATPLQNGVAYGVARIMAGDGAFQLAFLKEGFLNANGSEPENAMAHRLAQHSAAALRAHVKHPRQSPSN